MLMFNVNGKLSYTRILMELNILDCSLPLQFEVSRIETYQVFQHLPSLEIPLLLQNNIPAKKEKHIKFCKTATGFINVNKSICKSASMSADTYPFTSLNIVNSIQNTETEAAFTLDGIPVILDFPSIANITFSLKVFVGIFLIMPQATIQHKI